MIVWKAIPPGRPHNLAGYLAKIVRHISINYYHNKHAFKRGGTSMDAALEELVECTASDSRIEENLELKLLADVIADFLEL